MTQVLSALVVDDEPLARKGLRIRLRDIEGIQVIGECANGREALEQCAEQSPDVLFLDIQMPGMDGFDVIERLQGDCMPIVIFVTAFDQYAVAAFEAHAVDYLLKPVEEDRLAVAVGKAQEKWQAKQAMADKVTLLSLLGNITGKPVNELADCKNLSNPPPPPAATRLQIKDGETTALVPFDEIDWIEAAGDYMCVHAGQQTHILRSTLRQLEQRLPDPPFCRIHRSTLVNSQRVERIESLTNGEYLLVLNGGAQLKSGRAYKQAVRQLMRP